MIEHLAWELLSDLSLGFLSVTMVFRGVLSVFDYRLYADEERARAPILVRSALGGWLLVGALGVASLALMATAGVPPVLFTSVLAWAVGTMVLVDLWTQRRIGRDGSPALRRFWNRVRAASGDRRP